MWLQVPFRDSTLTKLLADGLLSAAQTTMLACLAPLPHQLEQSTATLHFASVARRIATKPVLRLDPHDQVLPASSPCVMLQLEGVSTIGRPSRNCSRSPGHLLAAVGCCHARRA